MNTATEHPDRTVPPHQQPQADRWAALARMPNAFPALTISYTIGDSSHGPIVTVTVLHGDVPGGTAVRFQTDQRIEDFEAAFRVSMRGAVQEAIDAVTHDVIAAMFGITR